MESKSLISTPAAILIGSVLISFSVLLQGGIIKLQGINTDGAPSAQQAQQAAVPNASAPVKANVTAGNLPTLGNNNAKVLVVEWADYQCPFCEKFFTDTYPQIKKDYIDTGKIKFAFRDFSFLGQPGTDPAGDESTNAANAARCAGDQGKYWEYHDYLYSHQGQEDQGAFSKDNLKQYATTLGLDANKFNSCVDNNSHVSDVQADTQAGKTAGVTGTPTVYVNGTQLVGALPYAQFKQALDTAIAAAK